MGKRLHIDVGNIHEILVVGLGAYEHWCSCELVSTTNGCFDTFHKSIFGGKVIFKP